jgi:hypothetical protein
MKVALRSSEARQRRGKDTVYKGLSYRSDGRLKVDARHHRGDAMDVGQVAQV